MTHCPLNIFALAAVALSTAFAAVPVSAATITPLRGAASGTGTTPPTGTFAVSSTDLVNQGQPTITSATATGTPAFGSSVSEINDGDKYGGAATNSTTPSYAPEDGDALTFTLDTTTNTLGYDITSIVSLTGFSDVTRTGQDYTVAFSTVGDPAFGNPIDVAFADGSGASERELQVTITPDTGDAVILGGVDAIRFTFSDVGTNGESVYREIDVSGGATIPEPASLMLLGLGSGLLIGRRRLATRPRQ